jgi:hypothetical protein
VTSAVPRIQIAMPNTKHIRLSRDIRYDLDISVRRQMAPDIRLTVPLTCGGRDCWLRLSYPRIHMARGLALRAMSE